MSTREGHSRTVAFTTIVGPSRWWDLVDGSGDVPPAWDAGSWTALVHATSDENEQTTGTHVEAARRSVASWDGDLETLTVVRSAAGAAGYAITWTLRRGSPPRLEVTGPDEAEVSAYAATQEELLAPRLESMAAEDAAAAPPGQAGRIWPAMDALGTAIAIGISVVVVLAIAGAVWAWSTH